MKNVKTNIKIIGVAIIVLMFVSILGYTGYTEIEKSKNITIEKSKNITIEKSKNESKNIIIEKSKNITPKPLIINAKAIDTPVAPIITYTEDNMILTYVFKTNRPKVVFGRNIELLGLAEDIVLIIVNNEPYQMRYNVEKEIKNCLIKVTDPDYSYLTVNITIQCIQ